MKKIHYNNLNFLRFVAAFLVIIHHIEQVKSIHGFSNIWKNNSIYLIGPLGVDLFFVLSGFLITSLLYTEKQMFKKISIPKFLMRRVLRIWPLYFVVFAFGFFIAPNFPSLALGPPFISPKPSLFINIILYVLFLPHVQSFFIGPILYCSQTWSVGIEENFYLIWPFLVSKLSEKKIVNIILFYIVAYILLLVIGKYILHQHKDFATLSNILIFFNYGLKFDCLLIGALFGIYNDRLTVKFPFLFNKYFQVFIYLFEILLVLSGYDFRGFFWEIHAVIYGLIILNIIKPKTSILNMEFPLFDYLGKISYGLYMYQFVVINVVIAFCYTHNITYLVFPMTILGVIGLAALSHHTVEAYFMKRKIKYSKIVTG